VFVSGYGITAKTIRRFDEVRCRRGIGDHPVVGTFGACR
jgi:hypothetical protein